VPQYLEEVRLILNIGPVRETERILYRGLPWRVDNLGVYSRLSNPRIQGAPLRVPLSALSGLESRIPNPGERWFPCKVNDWVLLSDNTYGQVSMITADFVEMKVAGGSTYTMSATGFLDSNPRCLSDGFGVSTIFGISYDNQANATSSVIDTFKEGIEALIACKAYGPHLKQLTVAFEAAGASSLDYKIIATMAGEAAESWFAIQRDLQCFALDVCNQQGWEIPFAQLVIHKPSDGPQPLDKS
jgi:hypothetical protein